VPVQRARRESIGIRFGNLESQITDSYSDLQSIASQELRTAKFLNPIKGSSGGDMFR
jgi:hypothetical protein